MEAKKPFNETAVLFPLLTLYSIVYMGLVVLDFAAWQAFEIPQGLMAVYMALLVAYAADKEIRRWTGKDSPSRKGVVFVYLWLILYLAAFVIYSFWPEFVIPADLTKVPLQVLGVFFGSKASKKIHEVRAGREKPETINVKADDPEKTILDLLRQKGKVKREDLLSATGLSRSSLGRLLDNMEQRELITQTGERKASYYELKGL